MWPRLALLSPALPPAKSSEEQHAKYCNMQYLWKIVLQDEVLEVPHEETGRQFMWAGLALSRLCPAPNVQILWGIEYINSSIVIISHHHHEHGEWRWRGAILQNVLLWTFARLFDWVVTLLHHDDAADGDGQYKGIKIKPVCYRQHHLWTKKNYMAEPSYFG